MSTHPEIHHLATEERIRAIAYSLWEEEGRPDGHAEDHWLRALDLVAAEAEPMSEPLAEAPEPDWLKRGPVVAEDPPAPPDKSQSLEQLAKRIAGMKAA
jgi:hypothetical protein